ncbi:MFS transporter [Rhodopila sp.]|uniref:MFS transporter n=1 Tax=Rhodopila sp. TaxID=2480087 RepID=UPI003D0F2E7B
MKSTNPKLAASPLAPVPSAGPHLAVSTKLFYGFGSVAFGVKDSGFSYMLLIFYNQVLGLPAPVVGLAIMIALIFDAFLDPIVGQISDHWRSRWGRRHPFMYAAALPVALSYLALWNPPHWSSEHLFFYLLGMAIIIRTFITFYEVPSSALAAELTQGYDERTIILSYRYFFGWIGGLVIYIVALRFLLTPDERHPVGQLNPAGYAHYGVLASAIMFFAIIVSALGTHRHIPHFRVPLKRNWGFMSMATEMVATWSHRSFLSLTLAGLATSMATGLAAAMNIYFNTFFWEFSARQISTFAIGIFGSAFVALFAAPRLSRRFGKRSSAMVMIMLSVSIGITPLLLRLVGLMPPNHSNALMIIIFFQTLVSTALGIVASTLVSAMIADVVEDSELRTGRRSEGLFFSASSLIAKAVSGIGIFAASMILGLIHFPAGARPGRVPSEVIRHLALVYVPIIVGLYVVALILMTGYKITRETHRVTLERLAAKADELAHGA